MTRVQVQPKAKVRGFTLVELMVVLGIIALTAAVALPNIAGYIRSNKIRTAQDTVAGALNRARNLAIMRNTQLGISFVVQNNTRFWVHIEDTIAGVTAGDVGYTRQPVDLTTPNILLSTFYDLPAGVEFGSVLADCPTGRVPGFLPANAALRFDRFGLSTLPANPGFPPIVVANGTLTNRIYGPATGSRAICIIDRQTRLSRAILIAPGGRVLIAQ